MYTALIIEPRKHSALQFVLKNFLENLDERWQFIIFHGTENEMWVRDMINEHFNSNKDRIQLNNLNVVNLSWKEYNRFCTSADFIEQIPTEIFLKFETDSMLCSSENNLIYDFLKYDYVGAPWLKTPNSNNPFDGKVGNSGLSLRRKSKLLEIIKKYPYTHGDPEDGYFCVYNNINELNRPSYEEAQLFSMETVFSPRCFGLHKAWLYQQDKIEEIESRFPGYKELIRLNSAPALDQATPPTLLP
jgi:hypothetical protein